MLQQTHGIVLRTVKYGETSVVCTVFTRTYGIQGYMAKGVRTQNARQRKAGLLQPGSLLDIVAQQKAQSQMAYLREFRLFYIYASIQEEIIKNSIALFSVEFLLRLLPEHAPQPELFDFCITYLMFLDQAPVQQVANLPVYFLVMCGRFLGFDIRGRYTEETPYANYLEGAFRDHDASEPPFLQQEAAHALSGLLECNGLEELAAFELNGALRNQLMEWLIAFMHRHTEHLSPVRSLAVLQSILH